jgi:hypothetical protein
MIILLGGIEVYIFGQEYYIMSVYHLEETTICFDFEGGN